MADVRRVAGALHRAFSPDKINFGAYGDTMHHLHFHLVPKYADDPFEFGDVFAMNPGRVDAYGRRIRRAHRQDLRRPVALPA